MSERVVVVVQARMGSSRLPGKVLLDIAGRPMLGRVVARTRRASTIADVIVATTSDPGDDVIAEYCRSTGVACYRGSQFDVLDRYYRAALDARADVVVRITADCPAIDPALIDDVVNTLAEGVEITKAGSDKKDPSRLSFSANRLPPPWTRTYPIGLDAEACTFEALTRAWNEAAEPQQREHVMPYLYEGVRLTPIRSGLQTGTTPRGFRVALLDCDRDLGHYRWTVDTAEDLAFIRGIFEYFKGRDDFSWREILDTVTAHPEMMKINADVPHKALMDIDRRAVERRSK